MHQEEIFVFFKIIVYKIGVPHSVYTIKCINGFKEQL